LDGIMDIFVVMRYQVREPHGQRQWLPQRVHLKLCEWFTEIKYQFLKQHRFLEVH